MTIRVALQHRTRYLYDRRVSLGPQVVRLRPAPHARTRVPSYSLVVSPREHFLNWQQDPHGNWLARLVFPEKTDHLSIEVELTAELRVINPFDFFLEQDAEKVPFRYDPLLAEELAPYLRITEKGPLVDDLAASLPLKGRTIDFLVELNRRVHERTKYVIRLEPGVQTPDQTLELRSGSCRDSAWLLVQVLRRLGLAARFASGYLIQLEPDQKSLDGPSGTDHDFTDLHAWAEVYLPGAGWIGLDATSGLLTGEGHIPVACTPEPASAAPLSGALEECESELVHEMRVTRIHETPRVTLPYSDEDWRRVEALGAAVDRDLTAGDVRLTMGGEPTFVSIDDMDGHEWNFGALGPDKRRLAGVLFRRLARRFAKGPLLHYGQGKWYPGEQLPRWALGCYWRKDGEPIWVDPKRCAEDGQSDGVTSDDAGRFLKKLAARLNVDGKHALPGYEDIYYYMLRERRLPVNVSVLDNRVEDELERARIARVFERGLKAVIGHTLPIRPVGGGRWESGPWLLRREQLVLTPGDSPMGYRLPVDSLPWVAPLDYPYVIPPDPFAERRPLPQRVERPLRQQPGEAPRQAASKRPDQRESDAKTVRTALCAEPRDGILHVFLPPVAELEDYLELVAAVEDSAADCDLRVRIEGYTPPHDPRLERFSVTPDPGVIEVNVHPSSSFAQLSSVTTALYEEAREARLGTEKFMLDGRHTGTGGGNHVTLGSSTPEDSPFLRRPDLLASLIGFWHDHPALSYLFSGLFIGPTSQAPRVDEARHEATHELEIAMSVVRELGARPVAPWLTDRVFRQLLADVTGNTHRTEFCIDKLYSPDSPTGRLGLLELRALEMPPHARMSIVEQLLVRALLASFWQKPYRAKLPRWGTQLHDRFMLPHFVNQDLGDVLAELRERGYAFERHWFDSHFEFRFPFVGGIAEQSVELELRRALEPWHVLPEEADAGGGTARSVDSSLERVQVRVRGAVPGRHLVACNGALVPLHSTGTQGESVAGVRFRGWRLPSALHPTIPVHAPLVFSLVDSWTERALGGCTLFVSHPGGRSYDTFPVNAMEAESRRGALFAPFGHAHGSVDPKRLLSLPNPDYPLTLDLRRSGA
ncbi:MAG TPA: transglutaminase family protein [Polyangiaceae bacterium]|nr:transglutaminase family protein [Polyangiaceae bacterium]